jgi:hypothetical protein
MTVNIGFDKGHSTAFLEEKFLPRARLLGMYCHLMLLDGDGPLYAPPSLLRLC